MERVMAAKLNVAVRAKDQDARVLDVSRQVEQQSETGGVCPVQVVEEQDHRPRGGQGDEEPGCSLE